MIARFNVSGDRLVAAPLDGPAPEDTVWIDLQDPTLEEERLLEASFAIELPSREDMDEIELSSRLYSEDGSLFMTAIVPSQS